MAKVLIFTHQIGQAFGTYASVRCGRNVLYTTRDYPFGFTGPARTEAENWASENGHNVVEKDPNL